MSCPFWLADQAGGGFPSSSASLGFGSSNLGTIGSPASLSSLGAGTRLAFTYIYDSFRIKHRLSTRGGFSSRQLALFRARKSSDFVCIVCVQCVQPRYRTAMWAAYLLARGEIRVRAVSRHFMSCVGYYSFSTQLNNNVLLRPHKLDVS